MISTLLRFAVFAVGGRVGVATDVTWRDPLRACRGGNISAVQQPVLPRSRAGVLSARDKWPAALTFCWSWLLCS